MKYVIFKSREIGTLLPVIVPEHVTHADIYVKYAVPVSAGFCYLHSEGAKTRMIIDGNRISETLKMGPGENDCKILQNVIDGQGSWAFVSDKSST